MGKEIELLERVKVILDAGQSVRTMELTDDERELVSTLNLLSSKPIIYCANVSEEDVVAGIENDHVKAVRTFAASENADVVVISGKVEQEVAELDDSDRQAFLEELGLKESGLDQLVRASYHLLNLISFLTAGPQEVRAWTIRKGTKAPQAGGKIHSDIERGFIRAETIAFEDLIVYGTMSAAKDVGKVRLEGKDYLVNDGDVMLFRFNV